jgi:hypothetical protein
METRTGLLGKAKPEEESSPVETHSAHCFFARNTYFSIIFDFISILTGVDGTRMDEGKCKIIVIPVYTNAAVLLS